MENKVLCACGCEQKIEPFDLTGRPRKYVNHHGQRKLVYKTKDEYVIKRKEYLKEWQRNNRKNNREEVNKYDRDRTHKIKAELIKLLGNKCKKCKIKYNGENGALFQFHHTNPNEKDHDLSFKNLRGKRKEKVLSEAKKCILLCANCHSLEHSEKF